MSTSTWHGTLAILSFLACTAASAGNQPPSCGDPDGDGRIAVTDGIQVLRAAAGLGSSCISVTCDVDASGSINVTDGVKILRRVAALSDQMECIDDPFISSVSDAGGRFGALRKIPDGLVAPPGAAPTVTDVLFSPEFVSGRTNMVTVEYDTGEVEGQGVGETNLSLLVASATRQAPSPGVFDLPISSAKGSVTIALALRDDITVQQFKLRFANGSNGSVLGEVFELPLLIIRENSSGVCDNGVVEGTEDCEPPGSTCVLSPFSGTCDDECRCETQPGPTPTPIAGSRYVDNGETVTDTVTGLEWEKKTTKIGSGPNLEDPHDADNTYVWTSSATDDDGPLFTHFLRELNTTPCFTNRCDWRIPGIREKPTQPEELETIVSLERSGCRFGGPCIDPIFGPTAATRYWSGTTSALRNPQIAGFVDFSTGLDDFASKGLSLHVRAVRGP